MDILDLDLGLGQRGCSQEARHTHQHQTRLQTLHDSCLLQQENQEEGLGRARARAFPEARGRRMESAVQITPTRIVKDPKMACKWLPIDLRPSNGIDQRPPGGTSSAAGTMSIWAGQRRCK